MGEAHRWRGLFGSIRVRILAAVVLLLAGSFGTSIVLLRSALLQRLDDEITVSLRREVEEFQLLTGGLNPQTGAPFGGDLEALFDTYFAREVPDDGETLLAFVGHELYHTERAPNALPAEDLGDAIAHWLPIGTEEEGSLDTEAGLMRYRVLPLRGTDDEGLLVVAHFTEFERAKINDAVRTMSLAQFGALIVASLIGLALAGRVLRPLRSLADTAQTISGSDLTQRIPVHGQDEASLIAGAFNDMLERLERAFATQRQFLNDAGHELRVPLSVIRGHIDLLELEADPDERERTYALIVDEIERMNRIVEDLLFLARAERPDFLSLEDVDLAELTNDVFRKAAVLGDRAWELEATPQAIIRADGQRLTQAMMQLTENACQHTDPGASIRIGSTFDGEHATLWVDDSGVGVPPGDAQRIFRRFVRASHRPDGSGLGLSIVAAIAAAHGGSARLASRPGPGARFEIIVPGRVAPATPEGSGLPRRASTRRDPVGQA